MLPTGSRPLPPRREDRDRAVRDALERARSRGAAPRLRPDQHIAGLVTRQGIFADHDPAEPGTLPTGWQVLGLGLWAGFTAGLLMRAWRARGGLGGAAEQD